ncbi:hypothetical protein [Halocalculus aciditolerans]|uniref:Uncharacterized protein n=1 Tax=Halocalculus aciditolerans TaxID=1383812 RepID=A0A830F8K9_9EURY|nr:hypothetical protein [Halocalculus aciditolerans]GGL50157.1 hypothetical protein GCM10009039_05400 [Halocalculus aciditolerans]
MIQVSAPALKAMLGLALVAAVVVGLVRYGRGRRPTRFLGGVVVVALAAAAGRTATTAPRLSPRLRTTALVFAALLLLAGVGFALDAVRSDRVTV